jgi:hypothetical protein
MPTESARSGRFVSVPPPGSSRSTRSCAGSTAPSAPAAATSSTRCWTTCRRRAGSRAAGQAPRPPRLTLPEGDRGVFTIGRADGCNLVLSSLAVSRLHAELRLQEGRWLLADLGSTNGTRLNGWRIDGPVEVRPGDQVTFGDLRFRIAAR